MSRVRKKPTQARAQATWDAILEATARLLEEGGYERLSTNRIAERAGVSIGSLYQYFPDKEAILGALVERRIERQWERLTEALPRIVGESPEVAIRVLVRALLETHRQDLGLNRVLFAQIPETEQLSTIARLEQRAVPLLLPYLESRRGELRESLEDLELAVFLCVRTFIGAVRGALIHRPELLAPEGIDRFSDELATLILRYLLP